MERRHMSDRQFQNLYDHHLPGLYRAALFLTGDDCVAEQVTRDAFLHTALNRAYAADERIFAVESVRRLYQSCKEAQSGAYRLHPGFSYMTFPVAPGEMTLGQRAVVAFSALGLSEDDLMQTLKLSRFTIRQYLTRFVSGVAENAHYMLPKAISVPF